VFRANQDKHLLAPRNVFFCLASYLFKSDWVHMAIIFLYPKISFEIQKYFFVFLFFPLSLEHLNLYQTMYQTCRPTLLNLKRKFFKGIPFPIWRFLIQAGSNTVMFTRHQHHHFPTLSLHTQSYPFSAYLGLTKVSFIS
jgi:hypothetical protein